MKSNAHDKRWNEATGCVSAAEAEKMIAGLRAQIASLERDLLSGLYVRRVGEPLLERLPRAFRMGLVVVVDIDDMKKKHNDVGGLAEGDRAVSLASQAVRKSMRAGDVGVRWGGDEFAIGLTPTYQLPISEDAMGSSGRLDTFTAWATLAARRFCGRVIKNLSRLQEYESTELPTITVTCASSLYLAQKRMPVDQEYGEGAGTFVDDVSLTLVDAVTAASLAIKSEKAVKRSKEERA